MKKLFYIATVLLCSAYGSMQAQVVSPDGIAYSDLQVKKRGKPGEPVYNRQPQQHATEIAEHGHHNPGTPIGGQGA